MFDRPDLGDGGPEGFYLSLALAVVVRLANRTPEGSDAKTALRLASLPLRQALADLSTHEGGWRYEPRFAARARDVRVGDGSR